jgi:hypothetical protein
MEKTMMKILQALALSVTALVSTTSNATIIEFDTQGLLMDDVIGGMGLYSPTGTFIFDTDTLSVYSVTVDTPNASYVQGSYDSTFEAFGLFTSAGVAGLVLDISIDFAELEFEISGLGVGDGFFIGADPFEFDNSDGTPYGDPVDPILTGTVLATVPLPASLPLLLAGLGGLSFAMRRRKS